MSSKFQLTSLRETGPRRLLVVIQSVLQAFPNFNRVGIVCHKKHVPILKGTARQSPVLDEVMQRRISKIDYFHGGESRGSNRWTDECDFLIVLGTPRVPPAAVRTHLLRIGKHDAAALETDGQRWGRQTWVGKTETGQTLTASGLAYANPDWAASHRALVHAELIQSVGRGRAVCEKGIPVVVLTNEDMGLPILQLKIGAGRVNDSDLRVISAIRELSALSATGVGQPQDDELIAVSPKYILEKHAIARPASVQPVKSAAIAKRTGLSIFSTINVLNRLLARNQVVKHGKRGGWSLSVTGPHEGPPP